MLDVSLLMAILSVAPSVSLSQLAARILRDFNARLARFPFEEIFR